MGGTGRVGEASSFLAEGVLHYYAKKLGPDKFELVGNLFQKSNYGFGLQNNSTLREPINQTMLKLNETGVIDGLKANWFGSEK